MDLIKLLPLIKRARNYYLYDNQGNRFLDLFLDNGRALAGHRPNGLSLAIKNGISRGLYAPYPSVYSKRIKKLLLSEFSRFSQYGLYRNLDRFLTLFPGELIVSDPAVSQVETECCLWRPYLPVGNLCNMLIVRFPFPGSDVVAVLSDTDHKLPESDIIAPYICSGFIRSFYDLKKRIKDQDEDCWTLLDGTKHWERKGPYLKPLCSEAAYEQLFQLYLDCKILLSPDYNIPSICASDLSEGDVRALYKKMKEANCE